MRGDDLPEKPLKGGSEKAHVDQTMACVRGVIARQATNKEIDAMRGATTEEQFIAGLTIAVGNSDAAEIIGLLQEADIGLLRSQSGRNSLQASLPQSRKPERTEKEREEFVQAVAGSRNTVRQL